MAAEPVMTSFDPSSSPWASRMLSVLRIVAAFLLICHGTQKLFGVPAPSMPSGPLHLLSMMGIAGILETFGGALLLVGLTTRPVAFLLSGELAVAYFTVHAPGGLLPIKNMGELAVIFSFLFLYLAVAGGGVWSVDHALRSRHESASEPKLTRSPSRLVA